MSKKPTVLCILDGFGLNPNPIGNAVAKAKKPQFDKLLTTCPHNTLITFGERVGLPEGQMGNSEVGHLNIGAGRVVEQWLLRISRALNAPQLKIPSYQKFIQHNGDSPAVHLIGLFSDGGVHSDSAHLFLLLDHLLKDLKSAIYLHVITDGRDCGPQSAAEQLPALLKYIEQNPRVKIATVSGRFFGMDRDKRWDRVQRAYDAIALGKAPQATDPIAWIKSNYEKKITDEFIEPAVLSKAPISPNDALIFWNFRADRMREIVSALCLTSFDGFTRPQAPQAKDRVLCFAEYDASFGLPFMFALDSVSQHLGEVVANSGRTQLRVAETEKYPHVTYFFNGGIEKAYAGEDREMVPSPRDVKTYDLKPEMSANGVTEIVLRGLASQKYDFIVVNFANCDMVGHTGVLDAGIKAVETVDICLGRILTEVEKQGGQALIIADHGNCEQMINYEDGTPHTSHTLNPVPVILFGNKNYTKMRSGGALCDVAPTLLKIMGLPQPKEMSGAPLVE